MTFTNLPRYLALTTLIGIAGLSLNVQGQRLYDRKRDEQAQQAKQQAAEIKSDPIFETQLRNLMTLEALDVETVMTDSRRTTRAMINSFVTWEHVFTAVETAQADLALSDEKAASTSANITAAKSALAEQIKNVKDAIKKLRGNAATAEDSRLAMLFSRAGEIDSLLALATKLITAADSDSTIINALDKTRATLKELTDLYNRYDLRVKEIAGLKAQLGNFYISLQGGALRGLEAEEEHLAILGTIETQRSLELAEARQLIENYEEVKKRLIDEYYGKCFGKPFDPKQERITDTVNLAMNTENNCEVKRPSGITFTQRPRDVVEDIMLFLYGATTIVSRVPTSVGLAELRRAHEEHRFAIKQRIHQAHAYELILNGGADRLSLFYKGGIKPAQLAQLIFNVSNVATPFAIMAR